MKPESEPLTAQESLDIITAMIKQTKGNVRQNSFYFLLWGWVVALANLGMFALTQIGYRYPFAVWIITIPAAIITVVLSIRQGREERVHSHIDTIAWSMWMCFGICIFTIVGFGFKINFQISPLVLVVSAIPTFVSGIILRFKPFLFGGISFWILGIVCFLMPMHLQPLLGAVAIVLGYLIPGYMLKNKKNNNV